MKKVFCPIRKTFFVLCCLLAAITGCADSQAKPPSAEPTDKPSAGPLPPASQLSGRATRAIDRGYTADYRFISKGGQPVSVRVTRTAVGALRYDTAQPGDAATLPHTRSLVHMPDGTYHCVVTAASGGCVLGNTGDQSAAGLRFYHVFSDWLQILASRSAALSVEFTKPGDGSGLAGVRGQCFSVEGVTASLAPPVDPGTYCFDTQGAITGLAFADDTLALVTETGTPDKIALPAPVAPNLPSVAAPSQTPIAPSPAR